MQAGRLVVINFGDDKDKLAVIADIVDQNRVIIDGPTTGIPRQVFSIKRISLTDVLIPDVPRGARTKTVRKALAASGAVESFHASEAGQKIAKATLRANLTDFERHQVMKAKKMVRLNSLDFYLLTAFLVAFIHSQVCRLIASWTSKIRINTSKFPYILFSYRTPRPSSLASIYSDL